MVSFSKGLGAPVGAALAGTEDFIRRAHRARKRFGGGMRQTGVLAAAARYGLDHHLQSLALDHVHAARLGDALDGVGGVQVVPPQTNIVMIDLPVPRAAEVVALAASRGVRISQWTFTRVRAVTHRDVSDAQVTEAASVLDGVLRELCAEPVSAL
jgi:threonine aldolase